MFKHTANYFLLIRKIVLYFKKGGPFISNNPNRYAYILKINVSTLSGPSVVQDTNSGERSPMCKFTFKSVTDLHRRVTPAIMSLGIP